MKYLSLFSGVGGFELGIKQAYDNRQKADEQRGDTEVLSDRMPMSECDNVERPLSCIGFSEIDKYATKVYKHHFPNHKNYGDITKINAEDLPDFELLVGGFPCQAFSIAGKRGGFEDTRGTLFFEIARIVREKQPRLLLLENVKGLLSHDKGRTFRTITSTLDELGYDTQWQVLNSKNHGVPQNRERVFIIGHLRGTSRPEVFPFIGDVQDDTQCGIHTGTLTSRYPASQREGAYIEETWDKGTAVRKLTPLECERLQGFPDNWTNVEGMSDTQRYKQMGNAVTVNVVRDIITRLVV